MKCAAVMLAPGSEEMETVISIDILRRARIQTDLIGLETGPIECSRAVRICPDMAWADAVFDRYDLLVLPGGLAGAEYMCADQRVLEILRSFAAQQRLIGAICAAPLVLEAAAVIDDIRFTCHPSLADRIEAGERLDERVVVDGNIVTSQGPGTAMEFALRLVEILLGSDKRVEVDAGLVR